MVNVANVKPPKKVYVPPNFIAATMASRAPTPAAAKKHLTKLNTLVAALPLPGDKSINNVVTQVMEPAAPEETIQLEMIIAITGCLV